MTRQERSEWDAFVYYQNKRVPDLMEKYDAEYDAVLQQTLAEFEMRHRRLTDVEKASMADPAVQARVKRTARVKAQIAPSTLVTEVMASRGIGVAIINDPRKAFIIGSHPVVKLTLPGKTNLGDSEVELWLPIASNVMVSPYGPAGSEKLVAIENHRTIRAMNELVAHQSNIIAGRSKALVTSLIRAR